MSPLSTFSCLLSLASAGLAWAPPKPPTGPPMPPTMPWVPPPPVYNAGFPMWGAGAWPPSNVGIPLVPQAADAELVDMLNQVDPARIQTIIETLTNFGTRHTLSAGISNATYGIVPAREWIAAQMRELAAPSNGRMVVTTPSYIQHEGERVPFDTEIVDVVATIKGSGDANRTYVITGHYDSRRLNISDYTNPAPGSDDNASGVAVMMELARIIATKEPTATMIFAATAGEEQDLYGATFLSDMLKNASTNVEANLNNDIVGTGSNEPFNPINQHTIRLFGAGTDYLTTSATYTEVLISIGGENDTPARNLGRYVQEINAGAAAATDMQVALIYRADRFFRGGDHEAFLANGYPAVRFTEPNEDFRHQHQDPRVQDGELYGDDIQFVDFQYTARVAKVNLAAMYSLATAPGMPVNVTFDVNIGEPAADRDTPYSEIEQATKFYWNMQEDPLLAGYELLWRPSSQQQWTHQFYVGLVDTVEVPLSKDNVVFGLRAVGTNGKKSPAVFPMPLPSEYGAY